MKRSRKTAGLPKALAASVLRLVQQCVEIGFLVDDAHAAPAAAERGLDDERKADLPRDPRGGCPVGHRFFRARQRRYVDARGQGSGRDLVAHDIEHLRVGTDELQSRLTAGARECRVFREEPVARVDEGDPLFLREVDDALDVEVGADRPLFLAQAVGFVGLEAMAREAVLLGVDGDGAQPQFSCGAEDPDGNLAAVRSQQFLCRYGHRVSVRGKARHDPRRNGSDGSRAVGVSGEAPASDEPEGESLHRMSRAVWR